MRALMIDDSRASRAFIRRPLLGMGFEVVEAENGLEGLERLQDSGPFDVALVDWNMPEMNGFEFLLAVRADAAFATMKIVMVTSESEMERIVEALESGADEYIMKPFPPDALVEKMNMVGLGISQ